MAQSRHITKINSTSPDTTGNVDLTSPMITGALGFTPYNASNPSGFTSNTGTVSSVGLIVPTGLSIISGSPITTSGTIEIGLQSGYSIPSTSSQTNWDGAYTARIQTFTTTGSSGAATWGSGILNIPNYTLAGLGGIPTSHTVNNISNGTGFLKNNGSGTWSWDNNTYATASSLNNYLPLTGGTLTGTLDISKNTTYTPTRWFNTGASIDEKMYDWAYFTDGKLSLRAVNDAANSSSPVIDVNRTGISIDNIKLYANTEISGTLKVGAYTLPEVDGSANQVLKTNGSGSLTWQNDSGISLSSLSATTPLTYNNTTGVFGINKADTSTNGYLSSTDWNIFNNKISTSHTVNNISNGTGFLKNNGSGTWSYDSNTYATASSLNNYLPLTGGTLTGTLTGTNITITGKYTANNGTLDTPNTLALFGFGGGEANRSIVIQNILNNSTAKQYLFLNGSLGSSSTVSAITTTSAYAGTFGFESTDNSLSILTASNGTNISPTRALTFTTGGNATFNGNVTGNTFIKSGGTSSQFLKADGSVDTNTYTTLSSLSATTPLSYNNGTGVFSISQANGSTNGYLSSTDWNTFNNKLSSSALSISTGQVAFGSGSNTIGGDNGLYWDNTNKRLGIGTTTPSVKLDIYGNIFINAYSHNTTTALNFGTTGTLFHQITSNRGTGEFSLRTGAGGHFLTFVTTNVERMRITQTGNIGINTTSPSEQLHVVGNGKFSGTLTVGAYTLPSTDGASNEVLKTDGTGTLYWKPDNGISLTSLSASAPLSYNNGTGVFSMAKADTSTNGYLSSTDWNTFNDKQAALGFTPENIANKKTTLADNSDTYYPTQKAVKTAVDTKQDIITGAASSITSSNLTANRALLSDGSGKVATSSVTATELGYVSGVTSNIQTQLNNKLTTAASNVKRYIRVDSTTYSGNYAMDGTKEVVLIDYADPCNITLPAVASLPDGSVFEIQFYNWAQTNKQVTIYPDGTDSETIDKGFGISSGGNLLLKSNPQANSVTPLSLRVMWLAADNVWTVLQGGVFDY